uniref:Uncharacterized protein n=1 Tax=Oryza sativa subsp. japonica TaxID=39947 RepID=Q6Z9C6_ORYSJ|nr:hypothetical protein [Oryza sativa Japonica Group]BAD09928.1 hypothetical protein [Oryza sativa Japonica Group]
MAMRRRRPTPRRARKKEVVLNTVSVRCTAAAGRIPCLLYGSKEQRCMGIHVANGKIVSLTVKDVGEKMSTDVQVTDGRSIYVLLILSILDIPFLSEILTAYGVWCQAVSLRDVRKLSRLGRFGLRSTLQGARVQADAAESRSKERKNYYKPSRNKALSSSHFTLETQNISDRQRRERTSLYVIKRIVFRSDQIRSDVGFPVVLTATKKYLIRRTLVQRLRPSSAVTVGKELARSLLGYY